MSHHDIGLDAFKDELMERLPSGPDESSLESLISKERSKDVLDEDDLTRYVDDPFMSNKANAIISEDLEIQSRKCLAFHKQLLKKKTVSSEEDLEFKEGVQAILDLLNRFGNHNAVAYLCELILDIDVEKTPDTYSLIMDGASEFASIAVIPLEDTENIPESHEHSTDGVILFSAQFRIDNAFGSWTS
ncbi:hypothetical protein DID77_04560 [Candidatus Marinamargulisbacteria bacterium SCGC AG-439-L15]|nr:hypothetical protein DID77_04560 [Candidatus Marinamargulisbacteria bacterium SCGC AG-439-L15]